MFIWGFADTFGVHIRNSIVAESRNTKTTKPRPKPKLDHSAYDGCPNCIGESL